MLKAIENFWDSLFSRVTRLWCWSTGKSNFALSRVLLKLGGFLIIFGLFFEFVRDSNFANGLFMIFAPIWLLIVSRRLKFVNSLEREVENGKSDVLHVDMAELFSVAGDRTIYGVLLPVFLPGVMFGRPVSVGLLFYTISLFTAFHFNGGGKSAVKRAAEALKKAASTVAEKVKDLIPEPAPAPIPALVGA